MKKTASESVSRSNFGMTIAIYLFGIFMGALDTGIVTPARTVIQNNLNVGDQTGIWMITIYTLAYAASIPIMGKLADKYGRKYVYLASISLFAIGSLLCGLSQDAGSFTMLIIARAIQAIGGGGILPVATAEFGTSFPPEKRGVALGLVGGVFGIANIFGASVGSAVLNIFGVNNWQFIFYINLPISAFVIICGLIFLKNNKIGVVKKTDKFGILLIVAMVLSLLYGLRNIDFFDLGNSISSTGVYPYLIAFIVMLPIFIIVERRAEDPVMNLHYFTNFKILITLVLSFIVGVVMMGMIFVPQFSENAVKIASGSGGYFVIILGIFAGLGAPLSGRLIDKYSAKLILAIGFVTTILGSLFLIFVTIKNPNIYTVAISLILIGLGMGFTIGTPLNYMMLENTKEEESNSALATLSLIRSIGTAIAPAIMVGFIAHAGLSVQTNVMSILPKDIPVQTLPYAAELTKKIDMLKKDENMKAKLANVTIPDLTKMTKIKIDMNSKSNALSQDLIDRVKSSDVTNITETTKILSTSMFNKTTPSVIKKITTGLNTGIKGVRSGLTDINKNLADMRKAVDGVDSGISGMEKAVAGTGAGEEKMKSTIKKQETALAGMNAAFQQMGGNVMIPAAAEIKAQIDQLTAAKSALSEQLTILTKKSETLKTAISDAKAKRAGLIKAIEGLKTAKTEIKDTIFKMTVMKNAVPKTFEKANTTYLGEIDKLSTKIENTFQTTLNVGFKQVYLTTGIAAFIALLILMFYPRKKKIL